MLYKAIINFAEYIKSNRILYNYITKNQALYQRCLSLYSLASSYQTYQQIKYFQKLSRKAANSDLTKYQKEWVKGDFYENPISKKNIFELARSIYAKANADTFQLLAKLLFRKGFHRSCLVLFDEGLKLDGLITKNTAKIYINSLLSYHRFNVPLVFNTILDMPPQDTHPKNTNGVAEALLALGLVGKNTDIINTILSSQQSLHDLKHLCSFEDPSFLYIPQERLYLKTQCQPLTIQEFKTGLMNELDHIEQDFDFIEIIPVYFTAGSINKLSCYLKNKDSKLTPTTEDSITKGAQCIKVYVPAHLIPYGLSQNCKSIDIVIGIGAGLGNLIKALPTIETIAKSRLTNSINIVSTNETEIALSLLEELPYIDTITPISKVDIKRIGSFDLKVKMSCFGQQLSEFENIKASTYIDYRRHFEFYSMCQTLPEHEYNHLLTSEIFGNDLSFTQHQQLSSDPSPPSKGPFQIGVAGGRAINQMTSLRQWPHLGEFVQLAEADGHTVKCFGLAGEYSESFGLNYTDLDPQETFRELKELDYFICSDGGLLHLANFFGVKTIGLYGPSNYIKNSPQNEANDFSILSNVPCAPCMFSTDIDYCSTKECMHSFKPDVIYSRLKKICAHDLDHDRQSFKNHELARKPKESLRFATTMNKAMADDPYLFYFDDLDIETFFKFQLHEVVYNAYLYGQLITTDPNSLKLIIHSLCEVLVEPAEISAHFQNLIGMNFAPALTACLIELRRNGEIEKTKRLLETIASMHSFDIKKHPKLLLAALRSLKTFLEIDDETREFFCTPATYHVDYKSGINPARNSSVDQNKQKNILWLCHRDLSGPYVRGGELSTRNIIDALAHSHLNLIISRSSDDLPPRLIQSENLLYWSINTLNLSRQVQTIISSLQPDIVCGYGATFAALLANRNFNPQKSVFFVRHFKDIIGPNANYKLLTSGQTQLMEMPSYRLKAFKKASKIIFNAEFPKDIAVKLCKAHGVDISQKASVCFVPVQNLQPNPNIKGKKIGLINPSRANGETLIRQLAKILPQREFVCIGVPKKAMPNNVEIVNWVDTGTHGYDSLYQNFAITICPFSGVNETVSGHGRVTFESIKLGIPVISETTDTMKEILPDEFLVPLNANVEQWAEKIEEILSKIDLENSVLVDTKLNDKINTLQNKLDFDRIIQDICEEILN